MISFRAGTIPWLVHDQFDMMADFCFKAIIPRAVQAAEALTTLTTSS
jgi:hypothetical protein